MCRNALILPHLKVESRSERRRFRRSAAQGNSSRRRVRPPKYLGRPCGTQGREPFDEMWGRGPAIEKSLVTTAWQAATRAAPL